MMVAGICSENHHEFSPEMHYFLSCALTQGLISSCCITIVKPLKRRRPIASGLSVLNRVMAPIENGSAIKTVQRTDWRTVRLCVKVPVRWYSIQKSDLPSREKSYRCWSLRLGRLSRVFRTYCFFS